MELLFRFEFMPLRKCILKLVIVFLKLGDFSDLISKFGFALTCSSV